MLQVSGDASAEAQVPPIVRCASVVHEALPLLLDTQDALALMSVHPALCSELLEATMRSDRNAAHCGHRCPQSWCCVPPVFTPGIDCSIARDEGQEISVPIVSLHRRLALLSLIDSMRRELGSIIGKSYDLSALDVRPMPFVWLTELAADCTKTHLRDQLNTLHPGLGNALADRGSYSTSIGLHFKHNNGSDGCLLCRTYCSKYISLMERGRDYWDAVATGNVDNTVDDDYFPRSIFADGGVDPEEMVTFLLQHPAMEEVSDLVSDLPDDEMKMKTLLPDYTDQFCPLMLKPLVSFFTKHCFTHILHAPLPFFRCPNGDELEKVELIGGVSPSGFFAGILLPHMYT